MICDDLREWLDLLRAEGELVEIEAEVDPYLEITEVSDAVRASPGGSGGVSELGEPLDAGEARFGDAALFDTHRKLQDVAADRI